MKNLFKVSYLSSLAPLTASLELVESDREAAVDRVGQIVRLNFRVIGKVGVGRFVMSAIQLQSPALNNREIPQRRALSNATGNHIPKP